MDIHDLPDYLRRLAREKPRELAQARADKIQALYDGVLRNGAGKDIEEVKALLAERWRAAFGAELANADLTAAAGHLAAGRRIKVDVQLRT